MNIKDLVISIFFKSFPFKSYPFYLWTQIKKHLNTSKHFYSLSSYLQNLKLIRKTLLPIFSHFPYKFTLIINYYPISQLTPLSPILTTTFMEVSYFKSNDNFIKYLIIIFDKKLIQMMSYHFYNILIILNKCKDSNLYLLLLQNKKLKFLMANLSKSQTTEQVKITKSPSNNPKTHILLKLKILPKSKIQTNNP